MERGGYTRDRGNPEAERPTLEGLAQEWMAPIADDTSTRTSRYEQGGTALSMQADQWAAPQARDHFPAHSPDYVAQKKAEGHGMRNLNDEAATWQQALAWPAPRTSDTNGAGLHGDGGMDLRTMAAQFPQAPAWPGPAARDHKGTNSVEHVTVNSKGSMHLDQLPNFVEHCFHPPLSPDQPIPAGATCSTASPNTNQPSARRKLNFIFVEALMRWPTGLSGFERQEMGSIPSPPPGRSCTSHGSSALSTWWMVQFAYLSALLAQNTDGPEQMTLL